MKLTPVMEKYILHWGEMGARWNVNRTVAQIHALLYLVGKPIHAEEISTTLNVARSNVSTSLKDLQGWGLVQRVHVLGDRRDHYDAHRNNWDLVTTIIEERKRRELDPTVEMLRQCVHEAEQDKATPKEVKERVGAMLSFLDELVGWYGEITKLPQATLLSLMKMGAKIGRLARKNERN